MVLLVVGCLGLLGFFDDSKKLTRNSQRALPGRIKLLLEFVRAAPACIALAFGMRQPLANTIAVPFLKNLLIDVGWFFLLFGMIVITGASNAVNLTDGLDGLAIVPAMIAAGCFGVIAHVVGTTASPRSGEHTSELQPPDHLACRLLL